MPLSEVVSFVCATSSPIRFRARKVSQQRVSLWKSKISDVKNCFFRFFATLDGVVPFWEAFGSLTSFAAHEHPVKK
jgi:hypothetical protein